MLIRSCIAITLLLLASCASGEPGTMVGDEPPLVTTTRGQALPDLRQTFTGTCRGRKFTLSFPIGRALSSPNVAVDVRYGARTASFPPASALGQLLLDGPGPVHAFVVCEPDMTVSVSVLRTELTSDVTLRSSKVKFDQNARLISASQLELRAADELAESFRAGRARE